MDDLVLVRWLGAYETAVRGVAIRPGDTFLMPRAEAESRTDVELVETPVVVDPDPTTDTTEPVAPAREAR